MNIFFRELRANLKSLIIWSVVMILLILVGLAKFAAFYNNPTSLEMLNSLPKAMLDALSLRAFNLTTLTGLYGIMFVYFALMGGIAAAMWGSDIISKEERDKTVEFSLVLPISRGRVVTFKTLAVLFNCIVFVLVTWGMSLAVSQQYKPDAAFRSYLALEMEAMFVLELIFLALGLLLGCAMKQYKLASSTALAIILIAYLLSIVISLQTKLDFLKYLTPFKYFDAGEILRSGSLSAGYLALSGGLIVVCLGIAYWIYNRRDLYI